MKTKMRQITAHDNTLSHALNVRRGNAFESDTSSPWLNTRTQRRLLCVGAKSCPV